MSYINMKSRRSFDFYAPYNEEGERLVTIPCLLYTSDAADE